MAIGADFAFGHEVVGGFQKAFEDCGGRIIQKIWPPLGTIDFGPYIPTIKKDADAIFTLMAGRCRSSSRSSSPRRGSRSPVLGGGTSYDEFVLPSMGDEVIGHVSALQYSAALDNAEERGLREGKYREKYGKVPSYYSESNYTTAQMIHEVMKKTKRQVAGARAVREDAVEHPARDPARPGPPRRDEEPGPQRLHPNRREEEGARLRQGRALEHA